MLEAHFSLASCIVWVHVYFIIPSKRQMTYVLTKVNTGRIIYEKSFKFRKRNG